MARKPKTATAIELALSTIEREVVASIREGMGTERSIVAREIAALQAAAKDGAASKTYSDLYRASVVAEILELGAGDAGLVAAQALIAKGATRTKQQQLAILAASNRLQRRLIAAGLVSAAPKAPRTPKAPKAPATPKPAPIVTLDKPEAWAAFYRQMEAHLHMVQNKNVKGQAKAERDTMVALLTALAPYKAKPQA